MIVGTRGETDEFFEEAYEFIASLPISQLHVFSYSERPGTAALRIPHVVDAQAKRERSKRLLALSEEKRKAHYRQFIGSERTVLWEHLREGKPLMGWTDNYIRVQLVEGQSLIPMNWTACDWVISPKMKMRSLPLLWNNCISLRATPEFRA